MSKIDDSITDLISTELLHYTCQIFKREMGEIKPEGSGVLAKLGDYVYIITASHVTENWTDENPLLMRTENGYVTIAGEVLETDFENNELDLAYIKLDQDLASQIQKGYKFLPVSKFRRHLNILDSKNYCVIGFPTVNQKIENGILKTGATSYLLQPCKQNVYDFYKLDRSTTYVLNLNGKTLDQKTDEKAKLDTRFHGISGCGLWLIILKNVNGEIVIDYRLIGIITSYRQGNFFCFIGNRIEHILEALTAYGNYKYKEIPIIE